VEGAASACEVQCEVTIYLPSPKAKASLFVVYDR
jgi:hypothetical protein